MDALPLLSALQLTDSALPTGRFTHSAGFESLLCDAPPTEAALAELVESHVCEGIAPLDGVIAAHAARASDLGALVELDSTLSARKVTPGSRLASVRCGRQLARVAEELTDDVLALGFAREVRAARTEGNLTVVEATLARATGLEPEHAVLLSLRGAATGALSAAVRLGMLSARQAQRLLASLHAPIVEAGRRAVETPLAALHSSTPELDLLALAHPRGDARSFAT